MKTEREFIGRPFSMESNERLESAPYICVLERPGKGFYAFFGIKIESIYSKSLLGGPEAANSLSEQTKLIQCAFSGMPDQSMELRYTAWPVNENLTGGRIDIAIIGRVLSQTHDEAHFDAKECWKNLAPALQVEASSLELVPITSVAEFELLKLPFDVKDIAEITRREEMIPLSRRERLYYPCPFIPSHATMSRLCKGLLAHNAPIIFAVSLQPSTLTLEERFYVENPALGAEAGFLVRGDKASNGLLTEDNGSIAAKTTYLMKVHAASSVEIPSYLLDLIGCEITAPPTGYDVSTGNLEKKSYSGGYSWYKPKTKEALETALNNLEYHEFNAWAPTLATDGVKRLRYIYDVVQANAAFRLPVPIGNEDIPGVRIKHGVPLLPFHRPDEGLTLGVSRYGAVHTEIKLQTGDRRKHTYIQGATGTGKTSLILNMALQDINKGKGVVVVDFHGDLSVELLKRLPKGRLGDLVYFNPADIEYPIGFNPLAYDASSPLRELQKERIASTIITWLKREFREDSMGPVFYQNVRNALFLVMADDDEPATLTDLVNIFYNQDFLKKRLEKLNNPMIRKFWTDAYNPTRYNNAGDNGSTILQYVISKFSPFVDSEMMRNIFGQWQSKMDIREIMDSGRVLICNFSKGLLGEYYAKFFGLMMLSKIEQAALSRTDIPEDERVDSFVYLDECQNLQTEHLYNLLSEMRKYRISITLANQHFSQLDERMRDAITGNCGTIIVFRNGVKDAELLEPMFHPYSKQMITRLSNFQAALRMSVNGNPKIFTLDTLPVSGEQDVEMMNTAVALSRRKYGMRIGVHSTDTAPVPEKQNSREAVQNC